MVTRDQEPGSLLGFTLTAAVVGLLTGVVASSFRVALEHAAELRLRAAHTSPDTGWWVPVAFVATCTLATVVAAWLVARFEPHAEGSGIPRVEAVVKGELEPSRFRLLPIKYIGGLLSLGSGLALGREGPSVQMGGSIATTVARLTRRNDFDMRILVAAGAAAGLTTAFSAPIAGGVFVLEELVKRFDMRTTLATLTCSACGMAGARLLVSGEPVLRVPDLSELTFVHAPFVVALGLLAGLLGVAYNAGILGALRLAEGSGIPVTVRAALIGLSVGILGWVAPDLVGPGDPLTQEALLGQGTLLAVCAVLVLRLILAVVSYAAATPGGLFAPMLVVGSFLGLAVGLVGQRLLPGIAPAPSAMALVGMAALFTASVRAPVTGVILATELTGSAVLLPPMLGACAVAMLVAALLRSEPIYDGLTRRAARDTPPRPLFRFRHRSPRPPRGHSTKD